MQKTLYPPFLKEGDAVAIVAISGPVMETPVQAARKILEKEGFRVHLGAHCLDQVGMLAGKDEDRLADFQQALDNPEIKAILFARGGYGASRIIDLADFSQFRKLPKWLVGFSDLTAIHLHLEKYHICSIHGVMPNSYAREGGEVARQALFGLLKGKTTKLASPKHPLNRQGKAKGKILGGNLSIINHCLSSPSEPNWKGAILVLEDLEEQLYHLDRMMIQLQRSGVLSQLAGLIIGQFSDMKEGRYPFGKLAEEIILQHVANYQYPVWVGAPIGHEAHNLPFIHGANICLEVTDEGSSIDYLQN
ncbi:LD-carboxypeptidase [Persicobacter diffluens]|uniref:Peptidase S66 n=1 Tax=Persicobacter diffluens TaxID=981 RepID=A0AAN4VUM9_9BACT|nr:peptidase S66 [Persicobacter diffluens]